MRTITADQKETLTRISQFIMIENGTNYFDSKTGQLKWCNALAVLDAVPMVDFLAIGNRDQLIARINVPAPSRGKGYGRLLLKQACDVADLTQTPLWVQPVPYSDGPMNKKQLTAWYERHGFRMREDMGTMFRIPY